jgi:DNA polymerase-3 subunit gamma/tau
MSYQVIARKWRPQRFDDVVGQQAVTRTLGNALKSGRLAQAFVFAGPRGVGKTTTARILAKALNCVAGPTAEPCGSCDACIEIAEGRDMDVLEIDAATHTQVDNIREVIITGLAIAPVRNRYKVFIIDEVHQLSSHSFNALLKSIEEPPPHVVFMMATTELEKIPDTVLSRAQVYEFRTISTSAIAAQLRRIVDAEGMTAGDDSLQLIARDAEGSMRDAQSKLDQVIAFTGPTIGADDVATVLGLVGRDLLLDALQAVADEDAPAAFSLAARAVEMGYDLRLVCRELSRVVRDLLVLSVDPSRLQDPEIAGEGERDRLAALARRFSREDLLRAFDLLTRAESDIRAAAQPRYHLEMVLLRWIYLRKLTPIEDLVAGAPVVSGGGPAARPRSVPAAAPERPAEGTRRAPGKTTSSVAPGGGAPPPSRADAASRPGGAGSADDADDASYRDALIADIRKSNPVLYNTLLAQAQRMETGPDRLTLTFAASQKIGSTFEKYRPVLEELASRAAGRPIAVSAHVSGPGTAGRPDGPAPDASVRPDDPPDAAARKQSLREQALADAGVRALLEVFPAEIRDVEEM